MSEKSCATCKYSTNIRVYHEITKWNCDNTPSSFESFEGYYETEFTVFYCSNYENVLEGIKK